MTPLSTLIYKDNPSALQSDVILLESYVSKYDLRYLPSPKGRGIWFVASDLSLAKGLAKGNYKDFCSRISRSQRQMRGEHLVLKGEGLRNYKTLLGNKGERLLGSSVTIVSWERSLDYLLSKHLPSTKQHIEFSSENQMQVLLMLLASYSDLGLRQETCFDYKNTCVRLDILDETNKIIYELKVGSITLDHIKEKHKYLEVPQLKDYKLVFVSPISCTRAAKNIIKANKRLSYMHITDLSKMMYENILSLTPASGMFYLNQTLVPKFNRILPNINSQLLLPGLP